jgi:HD superfamily phosphohydrolase YqeK
MAGADTMLPAWAEVRTPRLEHIRRVVGLVERWAKELGTAPNESQRWLRAAWLHDAFRDAPAETLDRWAPDIPGPVWLRHGPAAAARARAEGETDQGVLDAVEYHTVGYAGWDMAGRVLYCADFLEPGRAFDVEGCAQLAAQFPRDPAGVLFEVARRRLLYAVRAGWIIPEPTYRFWNSLSRNA